MRLSVMVASDKKELFLKTPLVSTEPSEIVLKSATVYWDYNNITDTRDFVTVDGTRLEFEHGYWSFSDIKLKLGKEGVSIAKQRVTGKCVFSVDDQTYFKAVGVLLGLENFSNMDAGATMTSPNIVDINRGLKSLDISCNIVDKSNNIDNDGQYSDVIASIPIPTDKTLKGSLSQYSNIGSRVKINRGVYSSIEFKVSSNIDQYVGDILLQLYITPK